MSRARTARRRSRAEIAVPLAILARVAALDGARGRRRTSRASRRSSSSSSDCGSSRSSARTSCRASSASRSASSIGAVAGIALGIPIGLSPLGAALDDAAHRVLARDPAAGAAPDLDPPAPLDRQRAEGLVHRLLLPVPGAAEHDRRRARASTRRCIETARSYGVPKRERIRRLVLPAASPQIVAGMRTSLSLAVIMMVLTRVLLEHERRRLRAAHLEEHVPVRADVGGDRADRRARLPPQRPLPARRAARPRVAPRLARGDGRSDADARDHGTREDVRHRRAGDARDRRTCRSSSRTASSSASSGPRAAARRRCSSASPACSGRRAARSLLRGRRVTSPPEEMALVFQEYGRSLMPWASVRSNVLLPLRHKKLDARRAQPARRGVARGGRPDAVRSTTIRGSSRAACSSASRSRARSRTSRRSC